MKIKAGKCVTETKLKFIFSENDQLSNYNYKLLFNTIYFIKSFMTYIF